MWLIFTQIQSHDRSFGEHLCEKIDSDKNIIWTVRKKMTLRNKSPVIRNELLVGSGTQTPLNMGIIK